MKTCTRFTVAFVVLAATMSRVSAKPNIAGLARQCDVPRKQKARNELAKLAEHDKDTEVRIEAIRVLSNESVSMHIIDRANLLLQSVSKSRLQDV